MELKVQIPFQQLLTAVKTLTASQKAKLRQELEEGNTSKGNNSFIATLLNGPVYTEKEIRTIEENRKSIAKWRTKK